MLRWLIYLVMAVTILFIAGKLALNTSPTELVLMNELIAKCQHDRELAERLIETERKARPNASRKELIRRALDRLNRDRR